MIDMYARFIGFKFVLIATRNPVDEVIHCAKVGVEDGIEMNIIIDGNKQHYPKRDSYARRLLGRKI